MNNVVVDGRTLKVINWSQFYSCFLPTLSNSNVLTEKCGSTKDEKLQFCFVSLFQASLGTTKYCSYFLKSMQCPKPDCMYLHELGDEAASFTKEEMQVKY